MLACVFVELLIFIRMNVDEVWMHELLAAAQDILAWHCARHPAIVSFQVKVLHVLLPINDKDVG